MRFWEIDFLRGMAIIMMVTFHGLFTLSFLGIQYINISSGFWFFFARLTAAIFITLVGISLTLSYSRTGGKAGFSKYLKRGIKIFLLGIVITAVTFFFIPENFIVFGVLHFIGISIMLAYPFLKRGSDNLVIGLAVILAGLYLGSVRVDFPWLLWMGLLPGTYHTIDYFPIFPWFGLVLIGIFLGNKYYKDHRRQFRLPDLDDNLPIRFFCLLGKNSLLIYLLHIPLIIFILYAAGFSISFLP